MKDESLAIIGSTIGTIIVSTIAIGTLIVLQHDSMRGDARDQIGALRTDMNSQFEAVRSDTDSRFAALRSDTDRQIDTLRGDTGGRFGALRSDMNSQFEAVRGDMREIRVDLGDVRERVARIEVILGGSVSDPEPAAN